MQHPTERGQVVAEAMADIRAIAGDGAVGPDQLAQIKARLLALAERTDLLNQEAFPPPPPGSDAATCLYRISEDEDNRFALYLNSSLGGFSTPVHNHTTWAVIVGISGQEHNQLYDRVGDQPPQECGRFVVEAGTGVALMPDDYHAIRLDAPVLNMHLYGLAMNHAHSRVCYVVKEGHWQVFPAHTDIREARA